MSEPFYCKCGAVLLEAVTGTGVQPLGTEEPIVFRRKTDYVICPECLAAYSAASLLSGASPEQSLVEPGEGGSVESLAEHRERRRDSGK